jgi:hypothetical protein
MWGFSVDHPLPQDLQQTSLLAVDSNVLSAPLLCSATLNFSRRTNSLLNCQGLNHTALRAGYDASRWLRGP